jgi:hypothetical protein
LTTAEDAAERALAGVLAGEPYVVTHGDLGDVVAARHAQVERAVRARQTERIETPAVSGAP